MDYESRAKIKLFAALFLFGSVIGSLWLGLTAGPELFRITGWYVGALIFAVLGILVVSLPTAAKQ